MAALVKARENYESTPRKIEGDLVRKARGDRGCLGDALSGVGALTTVVCALLASFSIVPLGFSFVGVGVLVIGFVIGSVSQSRSGKSRTRALESGPLTAGYVVRAEPHLREKGRRSGRATVLFTTDVARRFDDKFLKKSLRRIHHRLEQGNSHDEEAWARLVRGVEQFGLAAVPAVAAGEVPLFVGDVVVYPDLLEAGRLPDDDAIVPVIVDPDAGFVEHV